MWIELCAAAGRIGCGALLRHVLSGQGCSHTVCLQDPASRRVVDCRYPANISRWSRFKWNSSLQARTCCSPNPWWFPASTLIFWIPEWKSIQRDRHWSNWIHLLCRVGLGFTFVNLVQGEAVQNRLPAVGSLLLTQPFHLYPLSFCSTHFQSMGKCQLLLCGFFLWQSWKQTVLLHIQPGSFI